MSRPRTFAVIAALAGLGAGGTIFMCCRSPELQERPPVAELIGPGTAASAPWAAVPTAEVAARDYPQFQGPSRDATLHGVELDADWDAHPPLEVWRRPIGPGWSAFAVVGESAVTLQQDGDDELVVCYELRTGEERWRHTERARHFDASGGPGPRATPAIADGRVHALGATGLLLCLDLASGETLWRRDILADAGAQKLQCGMAGSPLVTPDGLVVVSPGGKGGWSLAAYRASDGEIAWHAGDDAAGYSSPVLARIAGRDQILVFNQARLAAHDPATGAELWSFAWHKDITGMVSPLVLDGDRVLLVTAYDGGAKLIAVKPAADGELAATELWHSIKLQTKFTSLVLRDGAVIGASKRRLIGLDLASGEQLYREGSRVGDAHLISAGELVLCQSDKGVLQLLRIGRDGVDVLGELQALPPGLTGAPPAFAAPFLLLRNHVEAVCYRIPMRESGS